MESPLFTNATNPRFEDVPILMSGIIKGRARILVLV